MPRQVPNWLLDEILGNEGRAKTKKDGTPSKAKPKQYKTMVKEGRKDPGMKNPRGGRYLNQTSREQLTAPVGGMPQPGPESIANMIMNEGIMRREGRRGFDKNDPKVMANLRKDTIEGVGKDEFLAIPDPLQAAEMIGMEIEASDRDIQKYQALKPTQRMTFWNRVIKNPDAPISEMFNSIGAKEDGKKKLTLDDLGKPREEENEDE